MPAQQTPSGRHFLLHSTNSRNGSLTGRLARPPVDLVRAVDLAGLRGRSEWSQDMVSVGQIFVVVNRQRQSITRFRWLTYPICHSLAIVPHPTRTLENERLPHCIGQPQSFCRNGQPGCTSRSDVRLCLVLVRSFIEFGKTMMIGYSPFPRPPWK